MIWQFCIVDDAPRLNNFLIMPHKPQSLNLALVNELLTKESILMDEAIQRGVEDIEVEL
jgi:hypothetical protein